MERWPPQMEGQHDVVEEGSGITQTRSDHLNAVTPVTSYRTRASHFISLNLTHHLAPCGGRSVSSIHPLTFGHRLPTFFQYPKLPPALLHGDDGVPPSELSKFNKTIHAFSAPDSAWDL